VTGPGAKDRAPARAFACEVTAARPHQEKAPVNHDPVAADNQARARRRLAYDRARAVVVEARALGRLDDRTALAVLDAVGRLLDACLAIETELGELLRRGTAEFRELAEALNQQADAPDVERGRRSGLWLRAATPSAN
jgi:hypothetical protein